MMHRNVFITGGTGYIGRVLIPRLLEGGHTVRALVRRSSEQKLPPGCEVVIGNALDEASFADQVRPSNTFVQLVGAPHPSPAKAAEFQSIDLASVRASVAAAAGAGIEHFVYVSVAQPAPVMKAYQAVRAEGEKLIRDSGMNATIIRPWYVLGPGHRWAYSLIPMYWLFERLPGTRETARRLGLVTLNQMVNAIATAVGSPGEGVRIYDVPTIRKATKPAPRAARSTAA
jgi:uncharacterized protein YbjT (DUF2867 family)